MNPTIKNPKSIADALGPKLVAKLVKIVKLVKLVVKLVKLVAKLVMLVAKLVKLVAKLFCAPNYGRLLEPHL